MACNRCEVLLRLLSMDAPAPEIILESDGDIGLDWYSGNVDVSIAPSGGTAWAITGGLHGTDLDELEKAIGGARQQFEEEERKKKAK